MVTILFRTVFVYLVLSLVVRLMGKRQIGELEVTDFVTTLLLSEIASLPITNLDIPVAYAVFPMLTLMVMEIFSSVLLVKCPRLRTLVSAKPTVIIQNGVLRQKALSELRITPEELMSEVRGQGLYGLSDVWQAILEKNGKLTVLPRAAAGQPSAEALGLKVKEERLMHVVYAGGKVNRDGLYIIGRKEEWLMREITRRGYRAGDLFCVTANDRGEITLIVKEGTE